MFLVLGFNFGLERELGHFRVFAKGWVVSKKVVLADAPRYQKPERGYIQMFPGTKNRNEGTLGCSPVPKTRNEGACGCSLVPKTGTRAHSPKPPFYETALLFPLDICSTPNMTGRRFHCTMEVIPQSPGNLKPFCF